LGREVEERLWSGEAARGGRTAGAMGCERGEGTAGAMGGCAQRHGLRGGARTAGAGRGMRARWRGECGRRNCGTAGRLCSAAGIVGRLPTGRGAMAERSVCTPTVLTYRVVEIAAHVRPDYFFLQIFLKSEYFGQQGRDNKVYLLCGEKIGKFWSHKTTVCTCFRRQ
jgi:hypothetical protein